MTGPWRLERGAALHGDTTRFSLWAPHAGDVAVRIVNGPATAGVHPMEDSGDGRFELELAGVGAGADYFYLLDGERERPDPVSRHQPDGVHGPSRVVDPHAHLWTDTDWTGPEMRDLVIYELHVGTFSGGGDFSGVTERLAYLRELGVTAIELMPVAQFPGERNWGYDGVHPYAPQNSYGGPSGLRRLVDAAHERGLAVLLDVVYNHLGPEGNYLAEYGPYFTDRYQTPWGRAVNFDGPESDEVRRYFIDNALHWISEYHIDGLRLDAVHAIYDFSAVHILDELAGAVHAQARALGRRAVVIAESDLNDPRLVRGRERGGYALDGQWSDDFHHAVHAALTGERNGYYVDFGGVADVAKAIRDRYVLDGDYSRYRRRRHGAPATDLPADRFVVFIQNHDQVGNRAAGERLSALVPFEARKLAAALLLLSPYVPLIFMGEEYAEPSPFLYFVDHGDPELSRAVREGRRREFDRFAWEGEFPDPGAPATFERSRLGPERATEPPHSRLQQLYRDLLQLRRSELALGSGARSGEVIHAGDADWLALRRGRETGGTWLAAFNLSGQPTTATIPSQDRDWRRRLCTGEERYDGPGALPPETLAREEGPLEFELAPWTAVLYGSGVS